MNTRSMEALLAHIAELRERAADGTRLLVGVCGPPGAGKSTLAAAAAERLEAVVVGLDGFHLSNRVLERAGLRDVKGRADTFDRAGFVALLRRLRALSLRLWSLRL